MKKIGTFAFSLLCCISLYASHNQGGYITFKHVQNYSYEISIVTFTNSLAVGADRDQLTLDLGYKDFHGNEVMEVVNRTVKTLLSPGSNNVQKNVYPTTNTFPGPGKYHLSISDPNWTAEIKNFSGSVNVPFYLSSELIIDPNMGNDNSPQFDIAPLSVRELGKPSIQGLDIWDADADSLSFALIIPEQHDGVPVPGYFNPATSHLIGAAHYRSEERRVGKECRSRWSPYH